MSCLFRAISEGLPNTTADSLRLVAVKYLRDDGALFEDGLTSYDVLSSFADIKQYLTNMEKDSTWGGAIEIRAIVEIYKTPICIHTATSSEILMEPFGSLQQVKNTIHVSYSGSHYDFLYLT